MGFGWWRGIVKKENSDRTYNVRFDRGVTKDDVPTQKLRLISCAAERESENLDSAVGPAKPLAESEVERKSSGTESDVNRRAYKMFGEIDLLCENIKNHAE